MLHRQQPRQAAAHQANHRTNGEVNAARDDDEGDTDADDPEERGAADQVLDVVARAETLAGPGGEEANRKQETKDAEQLFHGWRSGEAGWAGWVDEADEAVAAVPVARCRMASSLS